MGREFGYFGSRPYSILKMRKKDKEIQKRVQYFFHNEHGATAVEYGLLVALIAAVIFGAVFILGGSVLGLFQDFEFPE